MIRRLGTALERAGFGYFPHTGSWWGRLLRQENFLEYAGSM